MTEASLRLNLGCGRNPKAGWVNVDRMAEAAADVTVDLESDTWPWADSSVDEVMLCHVLEHLGQTTDSFFHVIRELYRVAKPGAKITIITPHPRSDDYMNDPTHVRPITPAILRLFDKTINRQWEAEGHANSPLGLYLDVDFKIEELSFLPEEPWLTRYNAGEINRDGLAEAERSFANVIKEVTVVWEAVK